MWKLVIFDFDGTLVNTVSDVLDCFNKALAADGFPPHTLESFQHFVGGDLETIVTQLLPEKARTEDNVSSVKARYRQLYQASSKPNTAPYPGIMQLLDQLREKGIRLAINSNKGQSLLNSIVEQLFPADLFQAVVGYLENRPSKPDPFGVHLICKACNCSLADAVYIGDGKSDISTAYNAGIPCILVKWGQGTQQVWEDSRVQWRVKTVSELENILLGEAELT